MLAFMILRIDDASEKFEWVYLCSNLALGQHRKHLKINWLISHLSQEQFGFPKTAIWNRQIQPQHYPGCLADPGNLRKPERNAPFARMVPCFNQRLDHQ